MVVRFEIYPALGVARVGNSDQHFVFSGPASTNARRRDETGKLLRQAVEFRIYKCDRDANGRITSADEVTSANATIQWSVHMANRKAVAMRFNGDVRRNKATGNDQTDRALIIDSGLQSVSSDDKSKRLAGAFQNKPVELGRIEMQANGRLIVIGGDGSAASPANKPIVDFANNDGWFDTIGDGPISAKVTPNGGREVDVLAAWVIVAPPDYAPGIENLVTMYDTLVDKAIERGVLQAPQTVVFTRHIRPVLERAMAYQWVNSAARLGYPDDPAGGHSSGGPGDFALRMDNLGDPTTPNGTRANIFGFLRNPDQASPHLPNRRSMPRLNDDKDEGDVFALTRTQYNAMRLWSQGQFVKDAAAESESEPEALTRVALEASCGGPFFPGIEAGRIMRDESIYMQGEPFRLSPDKVKPGGITENNAVPWQADFQQCRWEETDNGTIKRLGWWPAQRPDDVLKDKNADPLPWARGIPDTGKGMVANWHRLGFVKEDQANPGIFIEQERDQTLPDAGVA